MRASFVLCVCTCWSLACSGDPGAPTRAETTGTASSPIIGGAPAVAYPEAALVDMSQTGSMTVGFCSGALIAPQVILTAGHCIKGDGPFVPDLWQITLPYNGGQRFASTSTATYDYTSTTTMVDPNAHDIGLVFLPSAASVLLTQCPALATMPIDSSAQVVNVGRVLNGNASMTGLFVSSPISVVNSATFMYDYESQDVIESGDSGGPDEVAGSSPHLLVAVNSGAGGNGTASAQVLARVDLVVDWIQMQIMAHGGPCTASPSGSSGASSGGSSGSTSGSSSGSASGSTSGSSSGSGSSGSGSSGSGSGTSGSSGGSSGGATTGDDGGSSGNDGGPNLDSFSKTQQQSGCACRSAGGEPGSPPALALLGLGAVAGAMARRRSRR
jgi:MYXO-CTERM domain-containing protein